MSLVDRLMFSRRPQLFHETPPDAGGAPATPPAPPATPPAPKMVPESDLLAVKSGLQKDIDSLKSQLADTRGRHDVTAADASAKAARIATLEAELAEASTSITKVEELTQALAASETSRGEMATKLLETKRASLVKDYGYKPEDLKDATLDQLVLYEDAAAKLGGRPASNGNGRPGYDRGGSSGGADSREGMTTQEMISSSLDKLTFGQGNMRLR